MKNSTRSFDQLSLVTTIAIGLCTLFWSLSINAQGQHFNPKGKQPSEFTREIQAQLRQSLPFEDQRDFEESRRGFIAEPDYRQILGAQGNIVWDMTRYDFLFDGTRDRPINVTELIDRVLVPLPHRWWNILVFFRHTLYSYSRIAHRNSY